MKRTQDPEVDDTPPKQLLRNVFIELTGKQPRKKQEVNHDEKSLD